MNYKQTQAIALLQDELQRHPELHNIRRPFKITGESGDNVFTEFDGITVTIGKNGGYHIPAVRRYETGLKSASNARALFDRQAGWDMDNPSEALKRTTGHFGPLIDMNWRCDNKNCPCQTEKEFLRIQRKMG